MRILTYFLALLLIFGLSGVSMAEYPIQKKKPVPAPPPAPTQPYQPTQPASPPATTQTYQPTQPAPPVATQPTLVSYPVTPPTTAQPCPPTCPAPNGGYGDSDGEGRFGWAFDGEIRVSPLIDDIGESNVDPVVSILTPGLGYVYTKQDSLFQIGVRPEIVVWPHDESNGDTVADNVDFNWILPEFLAEYKKGPWGIGLAYKTYHVDVNGAGGNIDLGGIETIALYMKYHGLVLGYNFTQIDDPPDEPQGFVDKGSSFLIGYAHTFEF